MTSNTIQTRRLRTHYLESGPDDGIPVVLLHGNLSTGRFSEHLFDGAPDRYRLIAPDIRGFRDAGGRAEMAIFEGSGHFPPIDAAERWSAMFFAFLDSAG